VRDIEFDFAVQQLVHKDVSARQIQWMVRNRVPSGFLEVLVLDRSGLKSVYSSAGVELG
jgi:hypothetical protein